jgi:hypothetical protein
LKNHYAKISTKRKHLLANITLVVVDDVDDDVVVIVVVVVVAVDGEKVKQRITYGYSNKRILSITVRSYFCVRDSKFRENHGLEPGLV